MEWARSGLIESHQGVGGGYTLVKSPQKINLNEIVNAIEGPVSMVECIVEGEDECSLQDYCNIQSPILNLQRNLTDYFKNISLADL